MYKIIAIMGPAGSGKDSLMRKVVEANPLLNEIIMYTTRPKREGEIDGINYHYVSSDEFGEMILNDEIIEATTFNGWFYGTGYESLRSSGIVNIGVFNPISIEILSQNPEVELTVFYIMTSGKERLRRQLFREEDPDVMEIVRRFQADEDTFSMLPFDYKIIINEKEEDLAARVEEILAQIER